MPGSTTKGYPYPLATDRVADGDDTLRAFAAKADVGAGISCCGEVSVPYPGSAAPNSVTVTYPVGLFDGVVIPQVQTTCRAANPSTMFCGPTALSPTGFTVNASRTSGASAMPVNWIAHAPAPAAKAYPAPLGTAQLNQGDDAIHALADAFNLKASVRCSGEVNVPITAGNVDVSVTVTFPVGLFTATPAVVCSPRTPLVQNIGSAIASPTAGSVNLVGVRTTGNQPFPMCWAAQQP